MFQNANRYYLSFISRLIWSIQPVSIPCLSFTPSIRNQMHVYIFWSNWMIGTYNMLFKYAICNMPKSSIFLWREIVEQRRIMLSLYINKETDIFYLRNLTPLYEKKDFQYTGKIIKTGTFNLSKHYSITSEKNGISFYYKSISIPFLVIKFRMNFIPEKIYEQINLITFTSFGWENRKNIWSLWLQHVWWPWNVRETCTKRSILAVSLVYCFDALRNRLIR